MEYLAVNAQRRSTAFGVDSFFGGYLYVLTFFVSAELIVRAETRSSPPASHKKVIVY